MIRRSTALAFLLCMTAPTLAQDEAKPQGPTEPFLWKVEGQGLEKPSFLFGTIHLPDDRVLALPDVVDEALEICDRFYTEIPMDMATQMGAMQHMQLPKGKTLKDMLPKELYDRADAYMKSKGYQLAMFNRFKVWVVMSQMSTLDYMRQMMMGKQALDAALYSRQQKAGKTVGGIETIEEQIGAFEAFTDEEQLELFAATMDGLEAAAESKDAATSTEALISAYLSGDAENLKQVMEASQEGQNEALTEKFEKNLLVDRNKRMAERMGAKLKEHAADSHFFAIGTAHYPGDEGLIKLLEDQGYTVTRLSQADAGHLMPEPAGAGAH